MSVAYIVVGAFWRRLSSNPPRIAVGDGLEEDFITSWDVAVEKDPWYTEAVKPGCALLSISMAKAMKNGALTLQ
jgi:hypothetical protein